jgi:capsid protein
MVEAQWFRWCDAVGFSRKFWCMAHAKHVDGEAFAVLRRNNRLNHAVQYDLVLHEAEQCATPMLPMNGEPGYIDGIKFDTNSDDPIWYDFLRYHPGAQSVTQSMDAERVPAEFVLHWFKLRRPGQHRGVPEMASTLNTGAAARRWREAVLAAAETAADFTLFIKTQFEPDSEEMIYASDFSQQEITKRMMTALPIGYEPYQMDAKQPTATYEAFHKQLVNEMARAKNMPYNVAACDSSSYNYASGRLDHQTYYGNLDSDRQDGSKILDKAFALWFSKAVPAFQWLGGNPFAINMDNIWHTFAWPKHRVADIQTEAEANKLKLSTGELTLSSLYAEAGKDYEDELVVMARDYGLKSTDEMRAVLLAENFPNAAKVAQLEKAAASQAAKPQPQPQEQPSGA